MIPSLVPHNRSASPRRPGGDGESARSSAAQRPGTRCRTRYTRSHQDGSRDIPATTGSASRPCASTRPRHTPSPAPPDHAAVAPCAQTALLSAHPRRHKPPATAISQAPPRGPRYKYVDTDDLPIRSRSAISRTDKPSAQLRRRIVRTSFTVTSLVRFRFGILISGKSLSMSRQNGAPDKNRYKTSSRCPRFNEIAVRHLPKSLSAI